MVSAETIKNLVNSSKVVIFSKTYCPYCSNAKKLFEKLGTEYKAVELDTFDEGSDYQNILAQMTKQKTVPSIWVQGEFLGGFSDVKALHDQNKLVPKLQ
ncbi:hypothetical protein ABK040_002679 [Willaertia magna]